MDGLSGVRTIIAVLTLGTLITCSQPTQEPVFEEPPPIQQPPVQMQGTEEPAKTTTNPDTLRVLANALGRDWGTAIMPQGMNNNLYLETSIQQFNLIIPDYGMYMVNIQPQQGVWDFRDADRIVRFGVTNKMKVRGHTLVYGFPYEMNKTIGKDWTPTPAWVHTGKFSREETITIMFDYMTTVINRYGNQVTEWVVVNESAGYGNGMGFANNLWKARIGEDYVELAFKKARELAPKSTLILNEYGGDYMWQARNGRQDNIYNHVKKLVQSGVPIDAVGLQFHLTVPTEPFETEPTVNQILANFERYSKLGLDVYVTELDIKIKEPVTKEKLNAQAKLYAIVMEAVLSSDACKSISVWGYTDAYSWITTFNAFPGYADGCMFDRSFTPKPAYESVISVLKNHMK